jgi:hypothetical protein
VEMRAAVPFDAGVKVSDASVSGVEYGGRVR